MIPVRKPSYQHEFDLFWSGDDAIVQLPKGASKKRQEEHARKLRIARETGDWAPILVAGAQPTRFKCRPVAGNHFRRLLDRNLAGAIGEGECRALLLRMSLVDVVNLPGPDGEPFAVSLGASEYGQIASTEVIDYLDSINPGIVSELGVVLFLRATDLGKS